MADAIQDYLDKLTHKLLHQRQGLVGIRAEDVAGGTFGNGVGNYAFPVNVTIAGTLGVTGTATFSGIATVGNYLQTGWIELRNGSGNATIDFTRTPGSADFNVRLANEEDNRLTLWTANAVDSTGGGLMNIGNAFIGSHPVHGGNAWAAVGHKDLKGSGDYQILLNKNGETLFNCSGSMKQFRFFESGNNEWLLIDMNQMAISRNVNFKGNKLWMKAYNDNTHRIQWDSGLDGIVFSTWGYHRFDTEGGAVRAYIGNGRGVYGRSNNASWDTAAIGAEYYSWGGEPSVGWAAPGAAGQRFTMQWSSWYIYGRRNDGASSVLILDVIDESREASKKDIRALEKGHAKKVRNLKPKRFKKLPDPVDHQKWEAEVAEGKYDAEFVAKMRAEHEEEHIGFTAEDMATVYPEVVLFQDGEPIGIRYGHLTAVLAQAIQELDERVDALEAKGSAK